MTDLVQVHEKMFKKKRETRFRAFKHHIRDCWNRINGNFSLRDSRKIACMTEPPDFFLEQGMIIPHPFGITLSVDYVGADCRVGQNVTIGTAAREKRLERLSGWAKPKIGNLVNIYAGAVISGDIKINDYVVVAAQAFVSRDVPSCSIVYGQNIIKPLQPHHVLFLERLLKKCHKRCSRAPGLTFKKPDLYINTEYLVRRNELIQAIGTDKFAETMFSHKQQVDGSEWFTTP